MTHVNFNRLQTLQIRVWHLNTSEMQRWDHQEKKKTFWLLVGFHLPKKQSTVLICKEAAEYKPARKTFYGKQKRKKRVSRFFQVASYFMMTRPDRSSRLIQAALWQHNEPCCVFMTPSLYHHLRGQSHAQRDSNTNQIRKDPQRPTKPRAALKAGGHPDIRSLLHKNTPTISICPRAWKRLKVSKIFLKSN